MKRKKNSPGTEQIRGVTPGWKTRGAVFYPSFYTEKNYKFKNVQTDQQNCQLGNGASGSANT